MQDTKKIALEVSTILDSLAALSQDLSCYKGAPNDALVLSAGKTQDACSALDSAIAALRAILEIASDGGGGPVPEAVTERLDDVERK